MRSTVTIIGLTEFTEETIWNDLILPEGIDRGLVIDTILFECGELELLYSEPRLLARLIKNWAAAEQLIWQKLYATLHFEYNPIWNKDGVIIESEQNNRVSQGLDSGTESITASGTSDRSVEQTGINTEQVSAYDANTYQNRTKNSNEGDSQEQTRTDNESGSERENDRSGYEAGEREYKRVEQGNIGVTTTQSMILEERNVVQFDIYDYIAQSFKKRFCLCVY